jgi:hypothetical protein
MFVITLILTSPVLDLCPTPDLANLKRQLGQQVDVLSEPNHRIICKQKGLSFPCLAHRGADSLPFSAGCSMLDGEMTNMRFVGVRSAGALQIIAIEKGGIGNPRPGVLLIFTDKKNVRWIWEIPFNNQRLQSIRPIGKKVLDAVLKAQQVSNISRCFTDKISTK